MSEKKLSVKLKNKKNTCESRMECPFSNLTGFLICWIDEITEERRSSVSFKWADAYAQYQKWKETTSVEIWKLIDGDPVDVLVASYDKQRVC